ncbi:type II toxin-antitoxin system RelE/ParE family toxin [Bradyrhizobium elkanii]|uniref:type II toxin-antitoxin system RelE/ParE family toxin n=1 Tax=Bradyrhizobium elkanii TaxID=29448 RepID=UPI00084127D0|nr:type II toxin-antitoxin system RelE/ParE family toxin [Bradyrhizobium elkanii]
MANSKSAIKSSERKEDVPLELSAHRLKIFPLFPCKKEIGFALRAAQRGGKGENVKPLKGFGGASVLQIKSSFDGDRFRAVYTVRLKGAIYVLHASEEIH